MAVKTRAELHAENASDFPDNAQRLISAADLRGQMDDIVDSMLMDEDDVGGGGASIVFDGVADAIAADIAPAVDAVQTLGYATAGDSGSALYKRVGSEPVHAGKFQSADGAWWEIVLPSGEIRIEQLGGKADYVSIASPGTDNYAAIMAATEIPVMTQTANFIWGPVIVFGIGKYYCSQKINLKRIVTFIGQGAGHQNQASATEIYWPADTTFIETNSFDTFDGTITANTTTAYGSSFVGISFNGQSTSTDKTKPGFRMRTVANIRECVFNWTPGTGIYIAAQATGPAATRGNANGWHVERTLVANTGLHGLHVQYSDSNAGTAIGFQALQGIQGHGIWDQDTFGNTYIGSQIDAYGLHFKQYASFGGWAYVLINTTLATTTTWTTGTNYSTTSVVLASNGRYYKCTVDGGVSSTVEPTHTSGVVAEADGFSWQHLGTTPPGVGQTTTPGTNDQIWYPRLVASASAPWDPEFLYESALPVLATGASNRSSFIGTYTEAGISHLNNPAYAEGGISAFTRFSMYGRGSAAVGGLAKYLNSGVGAFVDLPTTHSLGTYAYVAVGKDLYDGVLFETANSTVNHKFQLRIYSSFDFNFSVDTNLNRILGITGRGTTTQFGRGAIQEGIAYAREFALGDGSNTVGNYRVVRYGTAAPTTGPHAAGEIVFDSMPDAGTGFIGWVCTVAGTPGTWKTFGAISP